MADNLRSILQSHQGKLSDKWTGYIDKWEAALSPFRELDVNVLEIGVHNGGTLEVLGKYFPLAKKIIGCDINQACGKLTFDDPRISIIIGDINSDEVADQITKRAAEFDIIIDDGSHHSSDIIQSFSHYFPKLNQHGIYIIEDLHTSYWEPYQGSLFGPYTVIAFLKRLVDLTNFEHWRNHLTREKYLQAFKDYYQIELDELDLSTIHSIEFSNSFCLITKRALENNALGKRIISGKEEIVSNEFQSLNGSSIHDLSYEIIDDQNLDIFSLIHTSEDLTKIISKKEEVIQQLEEVIQQLEGVLAQLNEKLTAQDDHLVELKNKREEENKSWKEALQRQQNILKYYKDLLNTRNEKVNELKRNHDQIVLKNHFLNNESKLQENYIKEIQLEIDRSLDLIRNQSTAINNFQTNLAEQEQTVRDLNAILADHVEEILRYVLDPTWKLTRPLRKIIQLLGMFWKPRELIDYLIIKRSGLFDPDYYLRANPDVRKKNIDPFKHFVKYGWKEGRNPSETINIDDYIAAHPELKLKNKNPLLAIIKQSKANRSELVSPSKIHSVPNEDIKKVKQSGLFSSQEYLLQYPDVRRADLDPLTHYLKHGWREGRNPSSLFNTKLYLESNPDIIGTNTNPLLHYLENGYKPLPISKHFSIKNRQFGFIDLAAYESRLIATPFNCDTPPTKMDVLIFPIIDWDFRFQRPQQLASQLAKAGHRVFYITTTIRQASGPFIKTIDENIFLVELSSMNESFHYSSLSDENIDDLEQSVKILCNAFIINAGMMVIDQPMWYPLAVRLKENLGWKVLYDCMDLHSGFSDFNSLISTKEQRLLEISDQVIVTSEYLRDHIRAYYDDPVLIHNATDFDFFHQANNKMDNQDIVDLPRPILGYIGAIANWFDTYLIASLAIDHPEWTFLLIGSTETADISPLEGLKNVHLLGEKPYQELPKYLSHFDVCLIPFKNNPLTQATNPVKLYEYLSAGKPVVSTRLAEIANFQAYIELADNQEEWEHAIQKCLSEEKSPELMQYRYAFAQENTWEVRADKFLSVLQNLYPKISVIIVTHNQLAYTKLCLNSILENTSYPNYEIVIVDNASTDGSLDYLTMIAEDVERISLVDNNTNLGFPKAINLGCQKAIGDYFVILNNDVIVTPGWAFRLYRHLNDDPSIGMVGPVTNLIGNEAKVAVTYEDLAEINLFAESRRLSYSGKKFTIDVLALYCCMISRDLFESVGCLDERYEIGLFEDDDLAMKIKQAGYKLICAEDVFVHHFHGASFKELPSKKYEEIFNENLGKFEQKWNIKWQQHQYRKN